MGEEESLLNLEKKLKDIVDDVRKRVNIVYSRYTDDTGTKKGAVPLPAYEEISKSPKLRYDTSKKLAEELDELIKLKLRVGVVERNLLEMKNLQITGKSDYALIANIKSNIKRWTDEMSDYRFEVSDMVRNANNKIRVLESASFYID